MAAIQLHIDGPLLSSIFYDNACCASDQEGFLIGVLKHEIEDTVDDTQINNRIEKDIIVIQSVCLSKSPFSFYGNSGEIRDDKLQAILGPRCGGVIGWFRARKNSSLEPSFLEKIIHQKLRTMTDDCNGFLFLLFTTQSNKFVSTHTFDHVCLRSKDGKTFDTIPLNITNLGNSAQGDYKRNTLDAATNKILANTVKPKSESIIQSIRASIESRLQSLCSKVSDSEIKCSQLEEEVEVLRAELLSRQESSDSSDSISLLSSSANKLNNRLDFSLLKESSSLGSGSSLSALTNPFVPKSDGEQTSKGSPTF